MAAQLQLTRISTGQPVNLCELDDELRKALGREPHPSEFLDNWMDTVGLLLAVGKTFEDAKARFPNKLAIVEYLEQNFLNTSYRC